MAKVAVTFRIMPEHVDVELGGITNGLRKAFGSALKEVAERPVAFGLVSLEAIIILDDAGGEMEGAETSIQSLEGVGSVEVQSADLL